MCGVGDTLRKAADTYQLPREDLLVKVELDLFIGDVYAELFKWIALEIFKAKNVQDTDPVIIIPAEQIIC